MNQEFQNLYDIYGFFIPKKLYYINVLYQEIYIKTNMFTQITAVIRNT